MGRALVVVMAVGAVGVTLLGAGVDAYAQADRVEIFRNRDARQDATNARRLHDLERRLDRRASERDLRGEVRTRALEQRLQTRRLRFHRPATAAPRLPR